MAIIPSINATTVKNLFEVGVPVMSQSGKERTEASQQAFEILLIRITGRRDLASTDIGKLMIENARQYVSSFRYEAYVEPTFEKPVPFQVDQESSVQDATLAESLRDPENAERIEQAEQTEEPPKPTQKLVVSFDEKAVKNSLWKQKLPVWGKTRPSTLLWVAIEDSNGRVLLDSNEPTPALAYIQKQAEKRGVPMLFPLLDLEDQININVTDVWGAFKDPIKNASLRYQPEAILSARLLLDPFGVWQTRWTLHQGSDEIDWQVAAVDLETAVVDGLDQLADRLAQRYAHISSVQDDSETLIYVTDVKSLSDYVRVDKYLTALSSIKRAELTTIKGDELVFRLDLRSNPAALKQAIKLGKVLLTAEDPFAPDANTDINNAGRLTYRLMP
ncbi:MAG: DUF2066 domain-containing protein [Gammaproteobacteria bacterium]|nr:DUF2066 domain-containing protein [Gammaproteobacteria bacterium]